MKPLLLLAAAAILLLAGCASPTGPGGIGGVSNLVRTTAYDPYEAGGDASAAGGELSDGAIHSAAADWSRYPVGTEFKIIETGEICQIDDYGSALVGTDTIDLFKDNGRQMRDWGVRMVHIKILVWGSPRRSLEILSPRANNSRLWPMIAALRQQTQGPPTHFHRIES